MQWNWVITYHPGLAAEVVDRVEGVDGVDATILEADDEAAEVLSQCHAVGVLPDQDKIGLEGPGRDMGSDILLSILSSTSSLSVFLLCLSPSIFINTCYSSLGLSSCVACVRR